YRIRTNTKRRTGSQNEFTTSMLRIWRQLITAARLLVTVKCSEARIAVVTFWIVLAAIASNAMIGARHPQFAWCIPLIAGIASGTASFFMCRIPIMQAVAAKKRDTKIELPEELLPISILLDDIINQKEEIYQTELKRIQLSAATDVSHEVEMDLIYR